MSVDYYDRQGQPLSDVMAFARLLGDQDYKRVAATEVGEARVSTVWLGLDHRFLGDGPPIIFETMIFGGPHSEDQWRYSTEAEAQAGHDRIVAALQEGRDPNGGEG